MKNTIPIHVSHMMKKFAGVWLALCMTVGGAASSMGASAISIDVVNLPATTENVLGLPGAFDVVVTGTVVDADGVPIPGVTVSVVGTGTGTATDIDGNYSLSVPEGSTLVFSFIGFETQRIAVGAQNVI